MTIIEQIKTDIERLENYYTSVERHLEALISFLSALEESEKQKEVESCHRTRKKLAEWSKTPEGRVAYEKVAEEMRNDIAITNNSEESEKPMNPVCESKFKVGDVIQFKDGTNQYKICGVFSDHYINSIGNRMDMSYTDANFELVEHPVCENLFSFLSTLETEKPMNPEDAMKELDEKIALVKQRGTWDGVDVDKYMDEVRGREPEKPMNQEGLEEEINRLWESFADEMEGPHNLFDIYARLARHFAQWGAEHLKK